MILFKHPVVIHDGLCSNTQTLASQHHSKCWDLQMYQSSRINNSDDNIKKYQQLRYQRADMSISLSFQNVSKLLKFDLLAPFHFNCSRYADIVVMSYPQSVVLIEPTTDQHAVQEDEIRIIATNLVDIVVMSYPQSVVLIEPTTDQHAVQEDEIRIIATNLEQNTTPRMSWQSPTGHSVLWRQSILFHYICYYYLIRAVTSPKTDKDYCYYI